ncbi:MAG: exodeoxyribonuclease VII large subunit [Firmicutes bacterium]|nr:exodeoxyribonuclease VII large subunit [Bacillota bacterium]
MKRQGIFTVSQVNSYLKSLLLQDSLLQAISVLGEISNYKLHKPSGHIYFTLKDNESIIRCVFFLSRNKNLQFAPADGMKVVARGNISLYARSGNYQLYVEDLKPEGIGALYLAFEQLKDKLKNEGLFDVERKKSLPYIPRCVGLVTSPTGAAVQDFLTTLKRRFPYIRVLFCPVAVQGAEAVGQIITALRNLDSLEKIDVLVLTRGGGSLEELWPFNNEELAHVISGLDTPVISAVGHETDFTIADFVADVRASTPTAAAELIAPEQKELVRHLNMQEHRLINKWHNFKREKKIVLENLSNAVSLKYPREKINQGYQRIDELGQRLRQNMLYNLRFKRTALLHIEEKLKALNPLQIMERGFALITDRQNLPLNSIDVLQEGQGIHVIFHDGKAACRVQKIVRKKMLDS